MSVKMPAMIRAGISPFGRQWAGGRPAGAIRLLFFEKHFYFVFFRRHSISQSPPKARIKYFAPLRVLAFGGFV